MRDIQALKTAGKNQSFALVLQRAVWFMNSLEKIKKRADAVGFRIDMGLYNILYAWCSELFESMKSRYNSDRTNKRRIALRF